MLKVPFTDLGAMARETWPDIEIDFLDAVRNARYVGGAPVEQFEQDFARYCGTSHAVGVANGTDALQLTLQALEVGAGDEVIVPSNTFIATAAAVVRAGAVPVFVDVDPDSLLLTAEIVEAAVTPRTRAVMVVHLYGNMPDMDAIGAVTARAGIHLVEDAAQAHGAEWQGRRAGSFGIAGCFSFYPGKNLGAFGDAGAVVTSDAGLATRVRSLANHGRSSGAAHYEHLFVGTNSRLDTLQAIALSGKLARNEEWTEARIALATGYRDRLAGTAARLTTVAAPARHVYHLMVVRVPDRERVQKLLADREVQTGVHYPVPCHQQPPLMRYARTPLPVCERAAGEQLSLPLFPHMTTEQLDHVCAALTDALNEVTGR
ncbi:DegT/DnrJ/EryC1/StrS family aminotransferase [Paractinoplanes rishiriensis]|uniref:Glutamine--scyllo-inositol aminotransferase n=1 Tax=Paractinoplanes rishiriensis TaxID=1050105 RepID=A0A919KAB7_9ACTN|nr:DegT/DnrJ/EryC1/StrS family aminotransferase [Actinoplanes rishiriensis]GIF01419.1 glutamine--scyllo-inositol aminotransferase [Actinoplanes rishiriensis]